jgi:hypothetical protein
MGWGLTGRERLPIFQNFYQMLDLGLNLGNDLCLGEGEGDQPSRPVAEESFTDSSGPRKQFNHWRYRARMAPMVAPASTAESQSNHRSRLFIRDASG